MFGDDAAFAWTTCVLNADVAVSATGFDGLDVASAVGGLDGCAGAAFDFACGLLGSATISVSAAIVRVVGAVSAGIIRSTIVIVAGVVPVVVIAVGPTIIVVSSVVGSTIIIASVISLAIGAVVIAVGSAIVVGRSALGIIGRGTGRGMSLRSWMRSGRMGCGLLVVGRG